MCEKLKVIMKNSCGRTHRRRRKKLKTSFFSEHSHCDVYSLVKWMCSKGFKPVKKLKPMIFSGSGRGLMAEETIYPDNIVVAISENLLITPRSVLDSVLGPLITEHCPEVTGQGILSIFLVYEKAKGEESSFYPYISSLPESYSIPAYFCDHTYQKMPELIRTEAKKQHEQIKTAYKLVKPLLESLKEMFPGVESFDLFKWAWCSVNTRSVYMKCHDRLCQEKLCTYHLGLAPFLDLLNHSADAKVTAGFNSETKCFEIISHCKVEKYSQVFINYGCHDNLKLFLEYGFLIQNNYNDHVPFFVDDISSSYKVCSFDLNSFPKKLKFITDNNLIKNAVCSIDGLSWNLSIVLKILSSPFDPKLWHSFLHQYGDRVTDSEFNRLKTTLIRQKIAELIFDESRLSCPSNSSECDAHLCLMSELCSRYQSILYYALE